MNIFERLTPRRATLLYLVATIAVTWPMAMNLARWVPGDLGDPLLNCWILAWDSERALDLLGADWGRAATLFHGNIFHPEPYALGYSELLFAQAAQALPVYVATGNVLLGYNLLFLSTYVLSALGAFLFVRELTKSTTAAWIAGLVYGFLPYRMDHLPHLQVLSSQWMPFALYGLRRYFDTGRRRPLAGATLALVAQNLSCGYYLLFFSPFVPAYVFYELWSRRRLGDLRAWIGVGVSGLVVAAATIPAMYPYLALRAIRPTGRPLDEVMLYSADLLAYLTASARLWWWGSRMRAFDAPEGNLFPGLTALALAVVGAAFGWRLRRARPNVASPSFFVLASIAAVVLSLGPVIRIGGQVVGAGPYAWLFAHVPGFDGLRVAARYGMVAMLFVAVLAGFGVAVLSLRPGRSAALAAALSAAVLFEGMALPFPTNEPLLAGQGLARPSSRLAPITRPPAVYDYLKSLPGDVVVVELPYGDPAWELRYTYYAASHWRPVLNGYSGYVPASSSARLGALAYPWRTPDEARAALLAAGTTHVVVHGLAFTPADAEATAAWLERMGAVKVATFTQDFVYALPARR